MRGSAEEALLRDSVARGAIVQANDSTKMQEVVVRLLHDEVHLARERMQAFGFTSVPLPMEQDGKGAEVVVVFPNGDRSQGIVVATDDRRYRPKNLKPGESAHHDHQGQSTTITNDGVVSVAKQHSVTAGSVPDSGEHELQSQLKGIGARLAQAEHNLHALFDVTSQFRQLAQIRCPEVAAVANLLNQDPATGLVNIADSIEAKAELYLQTAVQQALAKFLTPNLAGLASVLAGGIEAAVGNLQAEIASLLSNNPVLAAVDALQAELAALSSSNAAADVIQAGVARLQPQIDALIRANPIVGTVTDLRNQLTALISQAGPGLNFLAPQQRLVQGLTKSMKLSP